MIKRLAGRRLSVCFAVRISINVESIATVSVNTPLGEAAAVPRIRCGTSFGIFSLFTLRKIAASEKEGLEGLCAKIFRISRMRSRSWRSSSLIKPREYAAAIRAEKLPKGEKWIAEQAPGGLGVVDEKIL